MASVFTINKGCAKDPAMMVAMRELFLALSRNSVEMRAIHIETAANVAADAISRGDFARFFEFAREKLNLSESDLTQVFPAFDIDAAVARMQKARAAERRRRAAGGKPRRPPPRR